MGDGQSWPLRGAVEYEELNHTQARNLKNPGNQSKAWEGLSRGGEMGRGHVTTSLNGDASGCTQLCSGKKEMSGTSSIFLIYGAGYKILIFSSTPEIFQGLQATICQVRQLDCMKAS